MAVSRSAANEQPLDAALPAAMLGEAWALRVLYDNLAPRVLAYLRSRGASEPEDLTSEVFLTVFPRLAKVTGGAAGLTTFVFSVAHARFVDDVRRRARAPGRTEFDAELDGGTAPSAEDTAGISLGTASVLAMLAGLPDAQREVLTLRIMADLTVEQVAATLGRSPGAVKQLQRRGLLTVRELLQQDGVPL